MPDLLQCLGYLPAEDCIWRKVPLSGDYIDARLCFLDGWCAQGQGYAGATCHDIDPAVVFNIPSAAGNFC